MVPVIIMPVRPAMVASCRLEVNTRACSIAAWRAVWPCQTITAVQTSSKATAMVSNSWAQMRVRGGAVIKVSVDREWAGTPDPRRACYATCTRTYLRQIKQI